MATILLFLAVPPAWASVPTHVTLQLKWQPQFQFAGYYAAQVKGFYRAKGLDVTLVPGTHDRLVLPMVENGRVEFGVSDMEVFQAYLAGAPLVALGVVFQHSPTVILALPHSGIHHASDLARRTVMLQTGKAELWEMLRAAGVPMTSPRLVPHSWNVDNLLHGRVDAISGYVTTEPYVLRQHGVEPVQLRPIDYGVDYYGDLLFTTRAYANDHPEIIEAFRRASFQGWEYAMEHPEEMIDYILTLPGVTARGVTRAQLRFEAAQMRNLVLPGLIDIGHMNPGRFRHIAEANARLGIVPSFRNPEGFIYRPTLPARTIWFRVAVVALTLTLVIGLLAMLWITQLRRTVYARTRALRISEARYRTIINASPDAISIMDLSGQILMVSPHSLQLWRCPQDDCLVGHSLTEFLVPAERERAMGLLPQMLAGTVHGPCEFRGLRPDGSELDLEANFDFLQEDSVQPNSFVLIVRDITERRNMEKERLRLYIQLQQSQKMESLGRLAGGVAHDMNNMLGAILGMASMHGEVVPAGSDLQRGLEIITKAAERGGLMVKRLLNLARQSPAETQKLDLNQILTEVIQLLARTTLAQVCLELDLTPNLRPILGDPTALAQAFMNICVNAADAMAGSGTLILRSRNLAPNLVEIQVQDSGCGMSPDVQTKAIEPFFTTKDIGRGTGLGLAIVYSTVKAHQGQLKLHSKSGWGTLVQMCFPACTAATPGAPAEAAAPAPVQHSLRVLLVDDDDLVQISVKAVLEQLGHQVAVCTSGEAALARLLDFEPDAVILDMNMPGLGGAGTLPQMRALRPELPILLATGRADQTALDLVATFPGVTLMPKPFGVKELRCQLVSIHHHPMIEPSPANLT